MKKKSSFIIYLNHQPRDQMLRKKMKQFLVLLSIINYLIVCVTDQNIPECGSAEIQTLCLDQESCDTCLQAHVCCSWCYDQAYSDRKCNFQNQLVGCHPDNIEFNSADGFQIKKDDPFTTIKGNTNLEDIIQIKPQQAHLKLRKGVPLNFTFTYKPAENYPLDLYYLGDLSLSMSQNIEVFKSLGKDLPGNLTQLTKNYRLAYGSFVDKPGMPFYFTDSDSFDNPCHHELMTCEKGYAFRHRLDFTRNMTKFLEKINQSELTANVDDLDGALDAILQILNCDDIIGFSKNSRKIILLPTDSLLHLAGDGILVGATLRPTDECLIDDFGEYSEPLKYDYPSLEQIETLLRLKKVNIIFAVKSETKLFYYTNMTRDSLKGFAFVAELEEKSQNILDLIRSGFYSFAEQVSFSINQTEHKNFYLKFFADCENRNYFNETATCYNVKNEPVTFKVQITLKDLPFGKENDTLYVEEKNINERIELSVEYLGTCKCENYDYKNNSDCQNGDQKCGQCVCESGWTGKDCSEECYESDFTACRSYDRDGNPSRICNENGECDCGKCTCYSSFSGKYCEFECPSKRYKWYNSELVICGGPSHGKCHEGKCICEEGYEGEDCSCAKSQHDCSFDGTAICSDRGTCVCNECRCQDKFRGKYCEISNFGQNNTICDMFEPLVEKFLLKNGTGEIWKNDRKIRMIDETEKSDNFGCGDDIVCSVTTFESNSRCILEYCYYQGETNNDVTISSRKICTMTAGVKTIISGAVVLVAVLALGLIGILSYKIKIRRQEKAEFDKFMKEAKNAVEINPIYKSPVTEYKNPFRTKID